MITNFKYLFIQSPDKNEFLSVCYFEWIKTNRIQTYLHHCLENHIEPTEEYINWLHKTFPLSKELIIQVLLLTTKGKQKLADSMVQPLRHITDYGSIVRRMFSVEPMPEGALPVYDQNISTGPVRVTRHTASTDSLLERFRNARTIPVPFPPLHSSFGGVGIGTYGASGGNRGNASG